MFHFPDEIDAENMRNVQGIVFGWDWFSGFWLSPSEYGSPEMVHLAIVAMDAIDVWNVRAVLNDLTTAASTPVISLCAFSFLFNGKSILVRTLALFV